MSEPYLGEIKQVGFTFAPRDWALCWGQQISINQNSALFSLLGTNFGGNGQTTFALPDARGRTLIGTGQTPGGQSYVVGEMAGTPSATLLATNLPMHTHNASFTGTVSSASASATLSVMTGATTQTNIPTEGAFLSQPANVGPAAVKIFVPADTTGTPVNLGGLTVTGGSFTPHGTIAIEPAGGNLPFSIMQPFIGITTVIAMQGVFPSRN